MRFMALAWSAIRPLPMPLLVASAAGWVLLIGYSFVSPLAAICISGSRIDHVIAAHFQAALTVAEPAMLLLSWLTMLLAMMPPLLAVPLMHIWRRSLTTRRLRAITLFILGYAIAWIGAGSILGGLAVVLGSIGLVAGVPALAMAVILALLWQTTPIKQISMNRCHVQPPLAAFGPRADTDVLQYGLKYSLWCVGACWALMLLPLVANGLLHWPVMAAVMLASVIERLRTPLPPRWGAKWPHRPSTTRRMKGAAA